VRFYFVGKEDLLYSLEMDNVVVHSALFTD
jgi:hypothetical protein